MQRKSTAALSGLAVAILLACSRNGPPSSLFEAAGYHVRDGKVYYLNAFPGKAFEINRADAATFEALDPTYGRDTSNVYVKDRDHVYQRDRVFSDDPANFELLGGELAKDSHFVDGADPQTFPVDGAVTNCSEASISFAD